MMAIKQRGGTVRFRTNAERAASGDGAAAMFRSEMISDRTSDVTNLVFSELDRNLLPVVPSACCPDDKATDFAALSSRSAA